MNSYFTNRNIFLILFYLSFIDLFIFTLVRTLIEFNLTDPNIYLILRSDFNWYIYSIFFLICLIIFFSMRTLTLIFRVDSFKIYISKKIFISLVLLFFVCALFIFFEQKIYKIRYTSGSITTLAGLLNILSRLLLFSLFFIYQLNRNKTNFKIYIFLLVGSILTMDGLAGFYTFLSILLFEFYRFSRRKKFLSFIVFVIAIIFVLELAFQIVFNYQNYGGSTLFTGESIDLISLFLNLWLPRISVHGEQTFSYLSQDLEISSYIYLLNLVQESFKNIIKVIFFNGENLYYPKSIGQSIAFDIKGLDARGGSSPGFVVSIISFLPFTIPLIILLAITIKQFCYRLVAKINIIQVACFCWIIKGLYSNLLDMALIITPLFSLLLFLFISAHVYLKD